VPQQQRRLYTYPKVCWHFWFMKDKEDGRIITFCTGVRAGDTLMPMW
jgi:hypothetical protein